jgi:hypothetical protein
MNSRPKIVVHIAQNADGRISIKNNAEEALWERVVQSAAKHATPFCARILKEEVNPEALLTGSETLLV